ncbi:MAG: FeoB-associated Cys-rich membrane protein [Clostridia bacterium]|nr:FeoB-associated Cys-rich membrane protein [Clostridia bacterium]
MIDWIILAVIALIVGGAMAYIVKAKKSGKKCIGCPDSSSCGKASEQSGCSGSCSSCGCGCGGKTASDDTSKNE